MILAFKHSLKHSLKHASKKFLADDSGATAIEYGLICAAIGLAILAALEMTGAALIEKLTLLLNAFG